MHGHHLAQEDHRRGQARERGNPCRAYREVKALGRSHAASAKVYARLPGQASANRVEDQSNPLKVDRPGHQAHWLVKHQD